ncbi:MAG: MBL fold metallo-hydrolase [Anaerolineales bacterium]
MNARVIPLDLQFQGHPDSIACYLLPQRDGAALVECGAGATVPALTAALAAQGYALTDISHVFLTHIHLDHAGAAGFLARQGAQIFVHPVGAPHLLNPEKLIASATRIYGDQMGPLWGDFLAVPAEKLTVLQDGEEITVGGLRLTAFHTPGHAEHHIAYQLEDLCFTGDVGGVRISSYPYLRLPFVPPELHLEKWRATIERLQTLDIRRVAPTHFGIFDDADWHFSAILRALKTVSAWLEEIMPADPPVEELRARFLTWMDAQADEMRLPPEVRQAYLLANPLGMSADGMYRYWKKFRAA